MFLRVQIIDNLTKSKNTTRLVKQSLQFLRKIQQASLPTSILMMFYRGVAEHADIFHLSMELSQKKSP